MNKKRIKVFLLSFCFVFISVIAYSQGPPPPPPPPPPGLTIDGGLTFLLASGVIYGIFSLKRKK